MPYVTVTSNDIEWLRKIFNDTKRRALSTTAQLLVIQHCYNQINYVTWYGNTTTTTTTTNVRIIVLPSHSCGGTLQNLYLKLLHSLTQTSADHQSGQRQGSRTSDEKSETWSPFGMSKLQVRSRPKSLWWQTVPPRCSHRKGTVAKGSPTNRRHLQCRGVSTGEVVHSTGPASFNESQHHSTSLKEPSSSGPTCQHNICSVRKWEEPGRC